MKPHNSYDIATSLAHPVAFGMKISIYVLACFFAGHYYRKSGFVKVFIMMKSPRNANTLGYH